MKLRKITLGIASMFVGMMAIFAGGREASAENGVAINATNFPDANFRKVVSNYDRNSDGKLSDTELSSVTNISVAGQKLTSIKGIEYFTELTSLDCSYNYITELDASHNKKLTYLRADNNKISVPNVSTLTELEYVNFGGYTVETVDLSNCRKLKWAALGANAKSIDLTHNTELETLTLGGTFSELDLSCNTKLKSIYIGKANLKILDVRYCTQLHNLDIRTCTSIDLVIIPQSAVLVDDNDGKNLCISSWNNETVHRCNDPYANMWIDGWWYGDDGSQTYDGEMSWKKDDKGWWIEDTYGWYPVSCWQMIDYRWYYFDESGYMCADEYRDGYYLNTSGEVRRSWPCYWSWQDNGWKYKGVPTKWTPGFAIKSSWAKIDGAWYYFDDNCCMVTDQYVDGYWIGSDGVCQ